MDRGTRGCLGAARGTRVGVHEPFWLGEHKSGQIGVHKLGVHGGSGGVHE